MSTADLAPVDTDVIVVGAGPVGLTTALALGEHGIRCLLIDRSPEPGLLPKMDLTNPRSMEIFGRLGLAGKIRSVSWPMDAPFDVYAGPSLTDEPYAVLSYPTMAQAQSAIAAAGDGTQPREAYARVSQYTLEALLRDEATRHPFVQTRFGQEVLELQRDPGAVHVRIRGDRGAEYVASARYLVGCDGGNSLVRDALGITCVGRRRIARNLLIFFECPDLLQRAGLDPFRHYYLAGRRHGTLVAQDDLKRWALHLGIDMDVDVSALDPVEEIRAALGLDLDVQVLHCGAWTPHLLVAERYRAGRVFLAGDAAHQYIPLGGFGMNTGIADADNIAWKLAAVLHGWASPALLDSYEQERLPVGTRNCRAAEYAYAGNVQWRSRWSPEAADETAAGREKRRLLAAAINTYQRRSHEQRGTELGYRYTLSPACVHEPGPQPDPDSPAYQPTAAPGARLPHAWIEPGVSVHDRVGKGLTLLALDADERVTTQIRRAAGELGIPLTLLRIDGRPDLRELYGASLLLLRPDVHVAWRGDNAQNAASALRVATGRPEGTWLPGQGPPEPPQPRVFPAYPPTSSERRVMTAVQQAKVPAAKGGFRPKEYAHIVLKTARPEVLVDWYAKVLGLQVVLRHPGITFLTWDDSQDRLAIIPMPEAVAPAATASGLHHAAFELFSLRDLADQYRALKAQGITPFEAFNHGVATSMYFADPDGNRIELTVGAFETVEQLNTWLETGAFGENPLGVPYDPEELCARLDAGEAEEEILKPHPRHREYLKQAAATA